MQAETARFRQDINRLRASHAQQTHALKRQMAGPTETSKALTTGQSALSAAGSSSGVYADVSVSVYGYVYVYMYVHVCICIGVCSCICTRSCVCSYMCMRLSLCLCQCMHVTCIGACIHSCTYTNTDKPIKKQAPTPTNIHTHIPACRYSPFPYLHAYMRSYVRTYTYTHTHPYTCIQMHTHA